MEDFVFLAPAVAGQLSKMVEARIHNDAEDTQAEVRQWQKDLLGTYATPSFALIDPATDELISQHGFDKDEEAFAAWLEESVKLWQAR